MKHITLFLIILISMILTGAVANAEEPLTLDRAIAMALEQNPQVAIAGNNAAIARNNSHIGNADLLPKIDLSVDSSYQDISTGETGIATTTTTAKTQVTYTLFDGFGNMYRYKKLKTGSELGELEARDTIETTLLQVSTAFYAAAAAYENKQIAEELVAISEERLTRAKKRSAYGHAGTLDVLAAQVDYQADQVTVTRAKFLWDETRRNLNILLNREPEFPFTVETAVEFMWNYDLERVKASALSHNASYLAAGKRLQQSRYDTRIARSQFLPRLDFAGSFGYSQIAPRLDIGLNNAEPTLRLGATLSFNLFNGFKTKIQDRNALIREKNQELTLEQTRLYLLKEITSAYESYHNSLLVLDLEKKYLEAAELNFKRTGELYNLGQVTTTQFREAQLNLIRSRGNAATARYEAKINEIQLLRLTGRLIIKE